MKEKLEQIKAEAIAALNSVDLPADLENVRVRFLGKKGEMTAILKQMGSLSPQEPLLRQCPSDYRRALGHPPTDRPESLRGESVILPDEIDYRLHAVRIISVRIADVKGTACHTVLCYLTELLSGVYAGYA